MSAGSSSDYGLFGLRIRSELPLPEVRSIKAAGCPDVTIRESVLAASGPPGLHADGDALVLTIPDVAQYRISGGNEIVVDANQGVPDRNVRLYLLGSAFGALLHQRGLLPLHANAVEIEGRAIAFMGESGAGKSTLASWFHDRGYRVIADDVCVVRIEEEAVVAPGLARLRLWRDALEANGRSVAGLDRSYVGEAADYEKFDLPMPPTGSAVEQTPLAAICLLRRGRDLSLSRLTGVDAAEAVIENIYRGAYLDSVESRTASWETAVQLIKKVPVYSLSREWGLEKMSTVNRAVLETVLSSFPPPCA